MRFFVSFGVVVMALSLSSGIAFGQSVYKVAPHAPNPIQLVDPEDHDFLRTKASGPHATYSRGAGSITWAVTYADVTAANGLGFDDATDGATRQTTLLAVLAYVDGVLNSTMPATIDVVISLSETDGSGALAFAGTYFSGAPGTEVGFAGTHIETGVDPNGGFEDIFCTVDFGYPWESDHTATPAGGEFDLFSVLLHEMTHGLGFISSRTSTGAGALGSTVTVWDTHMESDDAGPIGTGSTTDLFDATPTWLGMASDLISDRLVLTAPTSAGVLGIWPQIYAPTTFAGGSSLSHWDTPTYPTAVMSHAIVIGTEKAAYLPFEEAMLADLGYSGVVVAGGTPLLNFTSENYGVLETDGSRLIGVNLSPASLIGSVSVTYTSSVGGGNPATPGADYTAVSSTLTWVMGESGTKTFAVPVASNAPVESTETVILTLSAPTGDGVLGSTTVATLNIVDPANLPMNPYLLLGGLAALGLVGFVVRKRYLKS
jgi:hypothetical protein